MTSISEKDLTPAPGTRTITERDLSFGIPGLEDAVQGLPADIAGFATELATGLSVSARSSGFSLSVGSIGQPRGGHSTNLDVTFGLGIAAGPLSGKASVTVSTQIDQTLGTEVNTPTEARAFASKASASASLSASQSVAGTSFSVSVTASITGDTISASFSLSGTLAGARFSRSSDKISASRQEFVDLATKSFGFEFSDILSHPEMISELAVRGIALSIAAQIAATSFALEKVESNALDLAQVAARGRFEAPPLCFLAGTLISMSSGPPKPIQEIREGDSVRSYDSNGNLVSGRVVRTMQNTVQNILDVHGLMVTPGHITLCGDGRFNGQHVPMIDILRSDGSFVKEDGSKIRACTNCELGSDGDRLIKTVAGVLSSDGSLVISQRGVIRLGTRYITENGYDISIFELIRESGGKVTSDGLIKNRADEDGVPFWWHFTPKLPQPEDYILQRSSLSLNDIYQAVEWEACPSRLAAPSTFTSEVTNFN